MDIRGKHALVTGAGAGIGRATVVALAKKGAKVVAADLNEAGVKETAAMVVAEVPGAEVVAIAADVSTPAGIRDMFAKATAAFGGLDIVHNNAGLICGEPIWPDASLEKIAATISVNLGGVAMGTQEAIKALRQRGGGAIVNTASVAALQAMPTDPVYSATKVGVVRIVESCTGFAGEGIRVNAVLPGMVDTDMTNKHTGDGTRPAAWLAPVIAATVMLQPEDIAAGVIELIEDDTAVGQSKIVGNTGREYNQ
jgi:NAD(P)-dependent dehydrogenase (short-subunit alcohol dehydrogenase family)